jgi:pimeloyl-ACP methyl ester carboxylesterase
MLRELGCRRPVLAGYDVGSRVAQHIARTHPETSAALVLAPPLPGVGHFSPLEAPERFATAIAAASRQKSGASSVSRA